MNIPSTSTEGIHVARMTAKSPRLMPKLGKPSRGTSDLCIAEASGMLRG
jgi:hypothetical protein